MELAQRQALPRGALLGLFVLPGIGAAAGAAIGGAMGGSLGTLIGSLAGMGKSHSEGISQSISEVITAGETISSDIQNSFALELMDYADNAIERLKGGQIMAYGKLLLPIRRKALFPEYYPRMFVQRAFKTRR